MDTGSSDLWVLPGSSQIQLAGSANVFVEESYGKGIAYGMIEYAELQLGGFTVAKQGELFTHLIGIYLNSHELLRV